MHSQASHMGQIREQLGEVQPPCHSAHPSAGNPSQHPLRLHTGCSLRWSGWLTTADPLRVYSRVWEMCRDATKTPSSCKIQGSLPGPSAERCLSLPMCTGAAAQPHASGWNLPVSSAFTTLFLPKAQRHYSGDSKTT